MVKFTIHTEESAPEESKALLAEIKENYGMVPNIFAEMAEAPGLLEAYKTINELFSNSSFNKEETTVIWQTVSVENACHYCVPVHTALGKKMGVGDEILDALRNETPLPNAKLEALRTFTLSIVRKHGAVIESDIDAFIDAGFTKRQILEVILGYTQKIISNYTNQIAQTPIDEQFMNFEWLKTG